MSDRPTRERAYEPECRTRVEKRVPDSYKWPNGPWRRRWRRYACTRVRLVPTAEKNREKKPGKKKTPVGRVYAFAGVSEPCLFEPSVCVCTTCGAPASAVVHGVCALDIEHSRETRKTRGELNRISVRMLRREPGDFVRSDPAPRGLGFGAITVPKSEQRINTENGNFTPRRETHEDVVFCAVSNLVRIMTASSGIPSCNRT